MDEEKNVTQDTVQEEEPKETFAEAAAKKEINYAAALREKNRRIQEEKRKREELEQRLAELESQKAENEVDEDLGTIFGEDKDDEVKKELEEVKKELEELKQQRAKDALQRQLDATLKRLKEKYKDSPLPFDENKVLVETLKRKPNGTATLDDIEIVYRSMLLDKIEEDRHRKEGVTEGSSQVGVEPEINKNLSYDEIIERWLKQKKK